MSISPNAQTMATTNTPPQSHTHQPNTLTNQSSSLIIIDKLKASIIERLTKLYPNNTLSSSQINSIQLQLQHAFPSFHIPTHPTYSIMIEKAIQELKEEGGSSEEAISEYISANYEGLPWAHKKFLSHYLDKLCQDGEVVCISTNHYSVPWLIDEFSKKVHPNAVDNLDGNVKNVNVDSIREDGEEVGVLVKRRVKRKRNSLVVQHGEEEEAGGPAIVEEHDNVVGNSEVKVSDDRVEDKEEDGTNEEHHIVAVDKVQSVTTIEIGSQSAPSPNLGDDVTAGGSSLAGEEKSEQVVSTMDKTLPGEHEEEVSIEELTNEPMDRVPAVVSVTDVDPPKDTLDKLVLECNDRDACVVADLTIVVPAKNREMVCGLGVPHPEEIRMRRMNRSRKKYKKRKVGKKTTSVTPTTASLDFIEGPKMRIVYRSRTKSNRFSQIDDEGLHELNSKLSESSISETPLQIQQGDKSSAFRSNSMISVIENSVEHEHGKQKLHSASRSPPPSHQSEFISMKDADLDLPLQLVLKMHSKQRKSSIHAKGLKSTKKMPPKGNKMTCRKRKEQVLQSDGHNSCASEKHDVERLHEMQQEQVLHKPGRYDGVNPRELSEAENEEITKENEGRVSNSPVETPSVKLSHHDLEYNDINRIESCKVKNEDDLKDLKHLIEHHQQQENDGGIANPPLESPSVKPFSPSHHDLEEDMLKQNEPDVQFQGSVPDSAISMKGKTPRSNQRSLQNKEVKKKQRRARAPRIKNENRDALGSPSSHCQKQEGLSELVIHQKSERTTIVEQIDTTKIKPATSKAKKKDGRGRPRKIKETVAQDLPPPLDLYTMLLKEQVRGVICRSENKHGGENSSRHTEPVTQGVGDVDLQQENHFLEEKDEKGVPNKEPDNAIVVVNLHPEQKRVPSETTNIRPRGRGRGRKKEVVQFEPETAMDEVGAITMNDQPQEGVSEQAIIELRKSEMTTEDTVAALKKQIEAANDDVAIDLDLRDQKQEGSFVGATHQMKKDEKKDEKERPPISEVAEKSALDLDIHPSSNAFNVFPLPVERKRKQQNVGMRLEGPVSLRTRSKQGGAHKPEADDTLLGFEDDRQGEERVLKTDQEKKQREYSCENLEESEADVRKSRSEPEQVTNCSDDVTLSVDHLCKVVLKHKPSNHIPPSAIRRSKRIGQQS